MIIIIFKITFSKIKQRNIILGRKKDLNWSDMIWMHWLYQNLIWIQTRLCSAAESKCALLQKLKRHGRWIQMRLCPTGARSVRTAGKSQRPLASLPTSEERNPPRNTHTHTKTPHPTLTPTARLFPSQWGVEGKLGPYNDDTGTFHTHTHTHLWPRPSSAPPPSHLCKHAHNHSTQQSFVVKFMS